jgi:hypothetical protein
LSLVTMPMSCLLGMCFSFSLLAANGGAK